MILNRFSSYFLHIFEVDPLKASLFLKKEEKFEIFEKAVSINCVTLEEKASKLFVSRIQTWIQKSIFLRQIIYELNHFQLKILISFLKFSLPSKKAF